MSVWRTLRFAARHPVNRGRPLRGLVRFFYWQLRARLWPGPRRVGFVNQAQLWVRKNMHGATGVAYLGIPDFEEMGFLLHYLRPGDCFVDVGANVGAYSIIAAAVCGALTHAVEPVPAAIEALDMNVQLNDVGDRVRVHPCALGASERECLITLDRGTMNQITERSSPNTLAVPMHTLDGLGIGQVDVLKLDVEGFEMRVLAGAAETLERAPPNVILIELLIGHNGESGVEQHEMLRALKGLGYSCYGYDPKRRALWADPGRRSATGNAILIRNEAEARRRVAGAVPFRVLGRSY